MRSLQRASLRCDRWFENHSKTRKTGKVLLGAVVTLALLGGIMGLLHTNIGDVASKIADKASWLQDGLNFVAQGHGNIVFGAITGVTGAIALTYLGSKCLYVAKRKHEAYKEKKSGNRFEHLRATQNQGGEQVRFEAPLGEDQDLGALQDDQDLGAWHDDLDTQAPIPHGFHQGAPFIDNP